MKIKITEGANVWEDIWQEKLQWGEEGACLKNTDEQFEDPYYFNGFRTPDGTCIVAYHQILDGNAEMDSNDFADWTNPEYIEIWTGEDIDEFIRRWGDEF